MDHREAVVEAPHTGQLTVVAGAGQGRMMDSKSWEMAKDVITDALKRSPSERKAYVRERCPDETLRAEVEALLRQYEEAPDFLEEPPHIDEPDELDDLQPGSHVGPYVIVDRLGRGGMGQVFLASDPRLHRKVALKCLISTRLAGDDRRRRILDEARAAARINNPNVATVHDVIEHDSRAFIVMEYVEGESLAARLKRERLPIDRVLAIGRQLAGALAAAHSTGIIHRDLKPANIQLTVDGSVKVLDFGVARAFAMVATASHSTTTTGDRSVRGPQVGTPGYMSPEQMLGRDVDDRSDVFSLGVILYEMTTGRRPYPTEEPIDLVRMLARRPAPADAGDARVPSGLADVIARALEIDAPDRFQSAADLGTALELVDGDLAASLNGTTREPISRRVARLFLAALLVPVVLGFLGFVSTAGLNNTFGRTGSFASEPAGAYFVWGLKSIVSPLFCVIAVTVIAFAMRFILRLLTVFPGIDRAFTNWRVRFAKASATFGLNDPTVASQAFAMLGVCMLAAVVWRYYELMMAVMGGFINNAPSEHLLPLQPSNGDRVWYRNVLTVLALVLSTGIYRVIQLRRRHAVTRGRGALSALVCMVGIMILMSELPYRIFHTESERLEFDGMRCYQIGEDLDSVLIYCPDSSPPRNHVIKRSDPSLRRLAIVENIFTAK